MNTIKLDCGLRIEIEQDTYAESPDTWRDDRVFLLADHQDFCTRQTLETTAIDAKYPNTEQVIPTEEPKLTIGLSANLLEKIASYAKANGIKGAMTMVKLSFGTEFDPVTFTIQLAGEREAFGVVMPMRLA